MANRYSYIKQVKSSTGKKMYATVKYPDIPPSLDDLSINLASNNDSGGSSGY
jgi:hypothetical protein